MTLYILRCLGGSREASRGSLEFRGACGPVAEHTGALSARILLENTRWQLRVRGVAPVGELAFFARRHGCQSCNAAPQFRRRRLQRASSHRIVDARNQLQLGTDADMARTSVVSPQGPGSSCCARYLYPKAACRHTCCYTQKVALVEHSRAPLRLPPYTTGILPSEQIICGLYLLRNARAWRCQDKLPASHVGTGENAPRTLLC